MRLHHLSVTAFGPFAGTETLDLDVLGADGLFLLHGATGAGKTSVLDAVAFALFGTVPGARREGRRLRSDHAAAGVAPEVRLELTVGGRRVRVVRRPEWQRPKRRGTGTTKEPASATLTWVDEPGSDGVTRIDEVARVVERLLGMSADQFFQVVLLPQGEFARFLRSSTDERATLLQRLFDTGRFAAAEDWLAGERRRTGALAEAGRRDVAVLTGKVASAAGVADDEDADGVGPDDPGAWAGALRGRAEAELAARVAVLADARAAARSAGARLAGQVELDRLVRRRDAARAELAVLTDAAAERAAAATAVERAHRAGPVVAAAADAAAAAATAGRAAARVARLEEELAADPDGAGAGPHLDERCAAWRAEVGRLDDLVARAAATAADEAAADALASRVAALGEEVAAAVAARSRVPADLAAAEEALTAARRCADTLDGLAREVARAREVAGAAAEVAELDERHVALAAAHQRGVEAHLRAKDRWLDLRQQRLDGFAAELAGTLELDAACVVCGSTVHPAPARVAVEAVTQADEAVAHELEQSAHDAAQRAGAAAGEGLRLLDAARLRAGGADAASAAAEVDRLVAEHAAAGAGAAAVGERTAAVTALRRRDGELATVVAALGEERALAGQRCDALRASVAAAHARAEAARGDDVDVHTRRDRLAGLAALAADLVTARVEHAGAAATARERADRSRSAAVAAGFDDEAGAAAAALAPDALAEQERLLAALRDRETAARAVLAEADVAALPDGAAAEVGPARDACATAESVLGEAQAAEARARHRAETLAELAAGLAARLAELGPVLTRAAEVEALADTVAGRGQNSRRTSLHSYVLAARLEEVAVAASARLQRMSGGRYELVHNDAAGSHGRRGGLGLDVRDDHTGVVRAAGTLSGGESFLASLSLALGLADVVAAESGGVLLDTLFIDEGFGTLDADTLDVVMGVLDELRAGGRVVGLVSHVDELRQRIPTRLHVVRGRDGSHLEAVTG